MKFTCDPCLRGRHFRCEGRSDGGCACSLCQAPRPTRTKDVRPRAEYEAKSDRRIRVPVKHEPRTWPKKPGPVPGAHGLKGRSTLDKDTQVAVETALKHDWSISQIAREYGISRDKVRTIKQRHEALGRSK